MLNCKINNTIGENYYNLKFEYKQREHLNFMDIYKLNNYLKLSIPVFAIIISFVFFSYSSVSFDIPEDHEDFSFLDSLNTLIVKLKKSTTQKEKKLITDPLIARQKKFAAKEQYFDMLLESQMISRKELLAFYSKLKRYYETRMVFFDKFLSILEGDDRAPCFSLYKQARDNFGAIQQAILKHTPQEFDLNNE